MDGFDKKRDMVKVLMDMLKKSASDEVSKGLPQTKLPGAEPAAEIGESSDIHKMTKPVMEHPHMEDLSKSNELQQKTSDSSMMADGGMALPSDEPERVIEVSGEHEAPKPVEPERDEDAEANYDTDIEENDDENNPVFDVFLPRKKRK